MILKLVEKTFGANVNLYYPSLQGIEEALKILFPNCEVQGDVDMVWDAEDEEQEVLLILS